MARATGSCGARSERRSTASGHGCRSTRPTAFPSSSIVMPEAGPSTATPTGWVPSTSPRKREANAIEVTGRSWSSPRPSAGGRAELSRQRRDGGRRGPAPLRTRRRPDAPLRPVGHPCDPLAERAARLIDAVGEDFRQLVRVDLLNGLFDPLELARDRLDDEQSLVILADPPLPAVDGVDVGDDVDAGRLAVAEERVRDVEGLVFSADRGDDDDELLAAHRGADLMPRPGRCQGTRGISSAPNC